MENTTVETVETVEDVIAALGGSAAVRRLTGATSQQLWNWKARRRIPARLYKRMGQALKAAGVAAKDDIWAIESPSTTDLPF